MIKKYDINPGSLSFNFSLKGIRISKCHSYDRPGFQRFSSAVFRVSSSPVVASPLSFVQRKQSDLLSLARSSFHAVHVLFSFFFSPSEAFLMGFTKKELKTICCRGRRGAEKIEPLLARGFATYVRAGGPNIYKTTEL